MPTCVLFRLCSTALGYAIDQTDSEGNPILVTVFSAPRYPQGLKAHDNEAAVLVLRFRSLKTADFTHHRSNTDPTPQPVSQSDIDPSLLSPAEQKSGAQARAIAIDLSPSGAARAVAIEPPSPPSLSLSERDEVAQQKPSGAIVFAIDRSVTVISCRCSTSHAISPVSRISTPRYAPLPRRR